MVERYVQTRGERRRQRILAYVRSEWLERNYSPTMREIAVAVDCTPATAHRHVKILADRGMIEHRAGSSRTIRPVQPFATVD